MQDEAQIELALRWGLLKGLNGVKICVTGKHSLPRTDIEALISLLGGLVQSSVTQTTTCLVTPAGANYRQGSKYKAALSHGVAIINEAEFCEMILPSVDELRLPN